MNTKLEKFKMNDWPLLLIAAWLAVSLLGGCGVDSNTINQGGEAGDAQAETQSEESSSTTEDATDDATNDDLEDATDVTTNDDIEDATSDTTDGGIEDEIEDVTDADIEDEADDTTDDGVEDETDDAHEDDLDSEEELINVIYGHPAQFQGDFFANGWASATVPDNAANIASDGLFFDLSHEWCDGTIWWGGVEPYLTIDLGEAYLIKSVVVQADDNDMYQLSYHVPGTDEDLWVELYVAPAIGGIGMQSREQFHLPESVEADAFRFEALTGDNWYSVGELQAFGHPVDKEQG
jgi:hypothetical protein